MWPPSNARNRRIETKASIRTGDHQALRTAAVGLTACVLRVQFSAFGRIVRIEESILLGISQMTNDFKLGESPNPSPSAKSLGKSSI